MTQIETNQISTTRNRILLEAGPIFAQKGFRDTTVREICEQAQVNLASINYYFGDKRQLYAETVVMAREMRVEEVPYPKWEPDTSPEQKLGDYVKMLLNRLVLKSEQPWQVRLLMREILTPTDACRQLLKEYFRPFFDSLLKIVDDIVGHRLEEHVRSRIGFSIIGQCLYYRFAPDLTSMIVGEQVYERQFGIDELAAHITQFSLGAIEQLKWETSCESKTAETTQAQSK